MRLEELIKNVVKFEWDSGNSNKNWGKHFVKNEEAEEVFFNMPLLVAEDVKHSAKESRFFCLGQTNSSRSLFISFTVRARKIRIISARDMNKKERKIYEKA
jgi:uncharacterized protein